MLINMLALLLLKKKLLILDSLSFLAPSHMWDFSNFEISYNKNKLVVLEYRFTSDDINLNK